MIERSGDIVDIASSVEMANTAAAIANFSSLATAPESHPDFDGLHCVECGNEIPEQRLKNGRVRCTYCQSAIERNSAIYGGASK